ncbi:WD40-repeat-containing domain protein [Gautieria morchelliformis]|nr:WD40-repeat-containing domain protein [Gautieria morchelliformis]
MPYRLSATLAAHSADVRAVASPSPNLVLSASRDTTAIAWTRAAPDSSFQATKFPAGSRYVNAVAYLPSSTTTDQGYLVAGGQDAIITVFSLGATREDPDFTLVGHTDNVCTLNTSNDGLILSGSWDKTARVWKDFQCLYTLEGHGQAVWAVLVVDSGQYLTASADKTIKLWHEHKQVRTYTGHTDAVRGLALVRDIGFASCANDSEIRIWTTEGDLVYMLSGHTSFIYSLSVLPTGEIVSAGEDRTVRIWRDGECAQTIVHPAISVWTVSTMPNGDIVSGTSDGIVRVFSNSEERWASEVDLKSYEDQVSSQAINKEQVGDLKQSDIKGVDALQHPGQKDGQVLLVREGQSVDAYQVNWDSTSRTWAKAGQVVDAVGSGRKQLYEGKEYDYVFDVDIQEGNPFEAAQRFLHVHELPLTYIDQVVNFIEKNTAGVSIGTSNQFVDPYTGNSRYQSTGNSSDHPAGNASTYVDPFTGASRYSGAPSQAQPPPAPIPFKQANVPAMRNKTYQINDALSMEISTSALAISSQEMYSVDQSFDYLTCATSTPPRAASPLNNSNVDTIMQILERWPASQRFPVMDLARLMSAFAPLAYCEPGQGLGFFNALLDAAEWSERWTPPLSKSRETNILLALRGIGNGFQVPNSHASPLDWVQPILERLLEAPYMSLTKPQRIVMATIVFNCSCVSLTGDIDPELRGVHLRLITKILSEETGDFEPIYRALAALGNFLHASKTKGTPPEQAQELRALVLSLVSKSTEERVKTIGQELVHLLQ